jgi:hypothetical protein
MVDGDIYARDRLDGEPRLLVGGATLDVFPVFARDGSKFAYVRIDRAETATEPELARLFVANPDGTGQRVVFGPTTIRDLAWSPRSDSLAVIDEVDGVRRLSVVDVTTGAVRNIPFDGKPESRVMWRPDGAELVFQRSIGYTTSFIGVRPDGTNLRVLSGKTHIDETGNAVITPDGKTLVYTNYGVTVNVMVLDLATGGIRIFGSNLPRLGPGYAHAGNVQLSADGKLVFGRYWAEDFDGAEINHQIWVASIETDGADGVAVSPVIRGQSGSDPFLVAPAPDGTQVVVHHQGTTETWVHDLSGGGQRTVDWGNFSDTDWQRLAP